MPAVLMRADVRRRSPVFAVFLLLRGHNQPGGGFVAGIDLGGRPSSCSTSRGHALGRGPLDLRPVQLMGVGSHRRRRPARARGSSHHPFLTSHTATSRAPLLGELHLPSAFVFDVGRVPARRRCDSAVSDRACAQSMRGIDAPRRTARPTPERNHRRSRHRRAHRLGRVAAAAAAHIPGHRRAFAAFVRGQSVHLAMGGLRAGAAPIVEAGAAADPAALPTRCRRRWC